MTREEKKKAIDALKISAPVMVVTQEKFNDYIQTLNKVMNWLEQEPCEDEYIKVPKKALKYRTAGMVAYNAEWLKNHFDIERVVICGAQQLCDDCISRQAVLSKKIYTETEEGWSGYTVDADYIEHLPSVKPQEKTGHWQHYEGMLICSECGTEFYDDIMEYCGDDVPKCCPDCGIRMVEP